ncbi:MAG: chemotaxis-specific protein-glutamate methyltransferase CheB [Proteobacteria bacterium]|nr:chemotaxis-specific protein-glutamate methyltransferase CheB [Pseudomonadota bacterium]
MIGKTHHSASRPFPIRVLVVEDSPVARELLVHILTSDPDIRVIAAVGNGQDAVKAVARDKPDLITMDVHMPGMDGFETTQAIMELDPVPIIIVTASCDMRQLEISFLAIEAGALAVLQKPQGLGHHNHERQAKKLISMVKLMSEVKVVRRWARTGGKPSPSHQKPAPVITPQSTPIHLVAIGASTGGPPVIQKILSELPKDFTPPILIVQHMAEGFILGFTEWLGQTSALPVHVAFHGSIARPGHVYIAPDCCQMKIDIHGRILCVADASENGLRPSVSYLFRSVAEVFGRYAIGVLLTGMGRDGAVELKLMKDKGAVTIAQNEESSVVFGMPGEAVKLDAAKYVLPADSIAAMLASLGMVRSGENNKA